MALPKQPELLSTPTNNAGNTFDHSLWDGCLKRHLSSGNAFGDVVDCSAIDYAGMAADKDYAKYLDLLKDDALDVEYLSSPEQLAFWMNTYNALCIQLIVDHEKTATKPLKSINELSGKGSPVWDKSAGVVAGKPISLNFIEHEMLRKKWDEPALHGCIVCASASCPNIRPEAFVGDKLPDQMKDQMRQWMKNGSKGLKLTFDDKKNSYLLKLSRIFLWFQDDFGGSKHGGVEQWISQFIEDDAVKKIVQSGECTVRYFEYDWQINRGAQPLN